MDTLVQQPYNLFAPRKQQAQDWADQTMQRMGIGQQKPQPITPPYEVGQQPAPKVNPADMTYVDDGKGNIIPSWEQKPSDNGIKDVPKSQGTVGSGVQNYKKPITSMDDLAAAMNYTSPQEEERLRKASVANQRIMAVADAIRHIGNIANTVNYAPSQQFNNPVMEENQRYQQGKALRDRANQAYLSYQQQKAAQDAKQKQWEAEQEYKRGKDERDFKFNAAKYANDFAYKRDKDDRDYAFNQQKEKRAAEQWQKAYDQRERQYRQSQAVQWYNAKTSRMNAENGGSRGGKEERRDTRRGYLTKRGASAGEIEATYHQLYEWGKKMKDPRTGKPYIDEAALKGQMNFGSGTFNFGGTSISQDLKERAVNQMLMEHDDAAVLMHDKYGWEWHEQKPNDKKNPYSQYIVQPSSGSNNGTDYSQYKRK